VITRASEDRHELQRWMLRTHKFRIGRIVYYKPGGRGKHALSDTYRIIGKIPQSSDGEPRYRIKHPRESVELTVKESDLCLA
jgi:hypothetical protein